MKHQIRKLNFWIVLGVDLLLLVAAHLLAYVIRFDGAVPREHLANISVLYFLLPAKLLLFHFFGLYRGMWRYTSLSDLVNILKACVVAGFMTLSAILLLNRFSGFSRAVFVLDALLTFLFIAGFRIGLRISCQSAFCLPFLQDDACKRQRRRRLLIIGAGDAAEKITREISSNQALPYMVVGFLDDHAAKIGQQIHGIPVLGPIADISEFVFKTKAQEVLIAIPSANRDQMQRFVELCRTCEIPFKTLPGLGEMISDRVSIKTIRDVSYKDLLGRPPVRLELDQIGKIMAANTVLVTGAGGSIGSELCRQIVRFHPATLILMDASEQNLYQIEMELLHEYGFRDYVAVLGKVQDKTLLESLFSHYRPTVVFHAAAYKHVPMVEGNPWEGVYNNIFASKRLMEVSLRYGVERFILISTDKAVRPTNVMGATKRMTEILMQGFCEKARSAGAGTRFMAVRFGNVLGSSGSVIPLFRRQIELGGPVTVTHPDMTRYFMSIEEASQLILQAATMGEGGEVFILEMGTPVRIGQMARDLIQLCGKEPDTEIEIRYTGLRPGEKMYEELITEGEGIVKTGHEKIMVLRGNAASLEDLHESLENLKRFASTHDAEGIKAELVKVIPEYTAQVSGSVLPKG
ncbi:MAG: polysaccharide biosynthesis protein [Desulfobulbaceae bacterium]|nr:polysaccharide biosynthesis protein [Desulfobulbaceae bacterium]HIJ89671.1 polysaccharide biosynthesis protein [Deltaproteobacteria bacterium]